MSVSLIATIIVIAFLVVFVCIGFYKGFLRIILTTFSLVITLILAGALVQPVADYVENKTVVGPRIQNKIEEYVDTKLSGVSSSVADAETNFIESLPLTASMKQDLENKNTLSNYVDQGVSSFSEYISANLTTIIIKVLSYILLFIVIYLLIRLILRLCNVINHIPVIGGVNRILGAVIGFAEGILFLWLLCLAVQMLAATDIGIAAQQAINESKILTYIFEHNYLMEIVNTVIGIFKK